MKYKNVKLIETESRMWLPGTEGWEKRDVGERMKSSSYKMSKFWRSNVTAVNNIVLYISKLLKQ